MTKPTLIVLLLLTTSLAAQQAIVSYTVAIFAPAATSPISTVIYPLAQVSCGQAKAAEVLPIVNPAEARFDDPADATKDCLVNITAQVNGLAEGVGYHAALKANGATASSAFGALTSPFERRFAAPAVPANPRLR